MTWQPITLSDIQQILDLEYKHFWPDAGHLFQDSFHEAHGKYIFDLLGKRDADPKSCMLFAAYEKHKLLAYTVYALEYVSWTMEPVVSLKVALTDSSLPSSQRIGLMKDIIELGYRYATAWNIPVIMTSTLRKEQSAFMKLYKREGFEIRGSFAIKRLSNPAVNQAV